MFSARVPLPSSGAPFTGPSGPFAKAADPSAGTAAHGMKAHDASIEACLRSALKRMIVFAAYMYLESEHQCMERIRVHVARPLWSWHGRHNKTLRSLDASIPWSLEMVEGGFADLLSNTALSMRESAKLARMGFTVHASVLSGGAWRASLEQEQREQLILVEDSLASLLGKFSLSLTGAIAKRILWLDRSWPGSSIRFLSSSLAGHAWGQLKLDKQLYEGCNSSPEPFDQLVAHRSVFEGVPAQQVCGWLVEESSLTDRVREACRLKHRRIMATQAVDDGFHECKDASVTSLSKELIPRAAFARLHDSKVLSQRHSYERLDIDSTRWRRNVRLPDEVFQCPGGPDAADDIYDMGENVRLNSIVGKKAPTWYSPDMANMYVQHADLHMLSYLDTYKQLHLKTHAWLGQVLDAQLVLRRVRPAVEGYVFFHVR